MFTQHFLGRSMMYEDDQLEPQHLPDWSSSVALRSIGAYCDIILPSTVDHTSPILLLLGHLLAAEHNHPINRAQILVQSLLDLSIIA